MATRVGCQARQYSDQMCCGRCGLAWDVNDDDPPECRTDEEIEAEYRRCAAEQDRIEEEHAADRAIAAHDRELNDIKRILDQ